MADGTEYKQWAQWGDSVKKRNKIVVDRMTVYYVKFIFT